MTVLRAGNVYRLSTIDMKCQKLGCSTIASGRLQLTIKSSTSAFDIAFCWLCEVAYLAVLLVVKKVVTCRCVVSVSLAI